MKEALEFLGFLGLLVACAIPTGAVLIWLSCWYHDLLDRLFPDPRLRLES